MEWDDLAGLIISLELQKYHLKEYLTKKDLDRCDELLDIYEEEKRVRVENLRTYGSQYYYFS